MGSQKPRRGSFHPSGRGRSLSTSARQRAHHYTGYLASLGERCWPTICVPCRLIGSRRRIGRPCRRARIRWPLPPASSSPCAPRRPSSSCTANAPEGPSSRHRPARGGAVRGWARHGLAGRGRPAPHRACGTHHASLHVLVLGEEPVPLQVGLGEVERDAAANGRAATRDV
eukprot:scaffold186336_cov24-Tisochrysis_lutea.AAC.2